MSSKEFVKNYYKTDFRYILAHFIDFFHPDCLLHWNSSKGFHSLDHQGIFDFIKRLNAAFPELRTEISHVLQEDNYVTTRYTVYVTTVENDNEETALAHYISIWELKDGKLFKGFEISQLADDDALAANSFSQIKV
ncbi:nuclear transport factor 2 family protein [Mangrovimonas sp. CR14]|uniref:nuclear transport factor 2 family protein n=1 Tax=Mangrovimonas sp. CR14 TaxID=2706120 RepID=UPI0014228B94|nr:nuclear transport factor 2 family protein [Mangrovimonas sp. CR14]NIK91876.1 nuclear transport factor 2 family protein [Mangrovimonas sp. CR14]